MKNTGKFDDEIEFGRFSIGHQPDAESQVFSILLAADTKSQCKYSPKPDKADIIINNIRTRDRSKDMGFSQAIQQKYGVRPRHLFGYINSRDEKKIVDAILVNSKDGISSEFLCSVAYGEGLNFYHEAGYRGSEKVDGLMHLGLENFVDDASRLKAGGYIPRPFNEGDEYIVGELVLPPGESGAGDTVGSIEFMDIHTAMAALTGTLAHRRDIFINDVEEILGKKAVTKLTQSEKDYWTYYYFTAGESNGRRRLNARGAAAIEKWTGNAKRVGNRYSLHALSNSLIRVATTEYIKATKVFYLGN